MGRYLRQLLGLWIVMTLMCLSSARADEPVLSDARLEEAKISKFLDETRKSLQSLPLNISIEGDERSLVAYFHCRSYFRQPFLRSGEPREAAQERQIWNLDDKPTTPDVDGFFLNLRWYSKDEWAAYQEVKQHAMHVEPHGIQDEGYYFAYLEEFEFAESETGLRLQFFYNHGTDLQPFCDTLQRLRSTKVANVTPIPLEWEIYSNYLVESLNRMNQRHGLDGEWLLDGKKVLFERNVFDIWVHQVEEDGSISKDLLKVRHPGPNGIIIRISHDSPRASCYGEPYTGVIKHVHSRQDFHRYRSGVRRDIVSNDSKLIELWKGVLDREYHLW